MGGNSGQTGRTYRFQSLLRFPITDQQPVDGSTSAIPMYVWLYFVRCKAHGDDMIQPGVYEEDRIHHRGDLLNMPRFPINERIFSKSGSN